MNYWHAKPLVIFAIGVTVYYCAFRRRLKRQIVSVTDIQRADIVISRSRLDNRTIFRVIPLTPGLLDAEH